MHFVTYNNLWLKCYINLFTLFYIVTDGKRCSYILARDINKFNLVLLIEKKLERFYKSNFSTHTIEPSEVFSRIYFTLSPFSMLRAVTISFGIVHLIDSVEVFA